jgi:hypothetical protein
VQQVALDGAQARFDAGLARAREVLLVLLRDELDGA